MRTKRIAQVMLAVLLGAGTSVAQAPVQIQETGIAGPTFKFVAGNLVSGNVVKGQPYSADAVTDVTQTLEDGTHISQHLTSSQYRDSEGRERREQTIANIGPLSSSSPVQTVFISDPVAGANYSLNPQDHTAVKLPTPPPLSSITDRTSTNGSANVPAGDVVYHQVTVRAAQNLSAAGPDLPPPVGPIVISGPIAGADPAGLVTASAPGAEVFINREYAGAPQGGSASGAQPNVEQLGTKTIQGVAATGTRTTFTIPTGQIGNDKPIQVVDERWYAADLQVTMQSTHSDPRTGTITYALSNVSLGEPAATLFQVPSDYLLSDAPEPFIQKAAP